MIPECYLSAVLNLVHVTVIVGHPEKERTVTAKQTPYFSPAMGADIDAYVAKCVKWTSHK